MFRHILRQYVLPIIIGFVAFVITELVLSGMFTKITSFSKK